MKWFCKNSKKHWYQIRWEYSHIIDKKSQQGPPAVYWHNLIGLRKKNIIFDARAVRKFGGKDIKHLHKQCLCNGRLTFIVVSYLGYFRKPVGGRKAAR